MEQIKHEVQHPESFYITVPKENEKEKDGETPKKSTKVANGEKKDFEYIQMTSVIIVANIDEQKITVGVDPHLIVVLNDGLLRFILAMFIHTWKKKWRIPVIPFKPSLKILGICV